MGKFNFLFTKLNLNFGLGVVLKNPTKDKEIFSGKNGSKGA